MLKKSQERYLNDLPPERGDKPVEVHSYEARAGLVAQKVMDRIKQRIAEADVRFLGSSSLGIPGKNDIDLFIFCPTALQEQYISQLESDFGLPTKNNRKWKWVEDGFDISVNVIDPDDEVRKEKARISEILENNPDARKRYEALKLSMHGKPLREYERAKMEFFNQLLDENQSARE